MSQVVHSHSSENCIRTEFKRNGIVYVTHEVSPPDDDQWYDLTIRVKRSGDVILVHNFPTGTYLWQRTDQRQVHVLMGNDFPSGVYSNEETAALALRRVSEKSTMSKLHIHWRLTPFNLDGDPNG